MNVPFSLPFSSQMVQNGARMANAVHATSLTSHFHTAWLFTTRSYVMIGWDWQWGEHGGRKANPPGLGGSNGHGGCDPRECTRN